MSTFTWKGASSTGGDPNDASDPANWLVFNGTTFVASATIPGAGDAAFVGGGSTVDFTTATGKTVDLKSEVIDITGSSVVLNFTGATIDTGTVIEQGSGSAAAINFTGTDVSRGQVAAISVGGTLTLTVAPASTFLNDGLMFATTNGTLVINSATGGTLDNYGGILAYGGNVVLTANVPNTAGGLFVGGSRTLEVGTAIGGGQSLVFLDTTGTLKLDSSYAATFLARIEGFQAGDTIDLQGVPATGLTETFNNGTLTLTNASSVVVATLRFGGSSFSLATFQTPVADAAGTGTLIETVSTVKTPLWIQPSGGSFSGNFGDPTHWSTGMVPTAGTIAEISAQSPTAYTVTINSAQSALTLLEAATTATVSVVSGGSLTLTNAIEDASGVFTVASGGSVTSGVFVETGGAGDLELQAGATLRLTGGSPAQSVSGRGGMTVENIGTISGATVNAAPSGTVTGGEITVGSVGLGSLTVLNGATVTDTYGILGAFAQGVGTLSLSGATTRWTDGGGDATTTYSGGMLVGGGGFSSITGLLSTGGAGTLLVDQGATLTEANFAIVGYENLASGTATVSNGAHWTIGTGTNVSPTLSTTGTSSIPTLTVGDFVNGVLNVTSGGTVQLGGAQVANTYRLAIGYSTSSTGVVGNGTVVVSGAGSSLDTAGGPVSVGQRGNGTLELLAGGKMTVGNGGTGSGFNFGVVVGSRNSATGTGNGVGQVTIDGTGSVLSDSADFVDGRDGVGTVLVQNSGSLAIGGTIYVGGDQTTAGLGTGNLLFVNTGGQASAAGLTMWAGSVVGVTSGSGLALGAGATQSSGQLTIASGATLQGAGLVTVVSPTSLIMNNGVVQSAFAGSTLELNGVLAGSGSYIAGAAGLNGTVLRLDGAVSAGVNVMMGGAVQSTLDLALPIGFQGTISQFYGTGTGADVVDLVLLNRSATNPVLSYLPNADATTGGTIQVVSSSGTLDLSVSGYHPGGFTLGSDAATGTTITANDAAACFVAGTRILTARGEVAVEALRLGDLVATLDGRLRPVRWLGQTRIDLDRHPRAAQVGPVRIAADAFAPGMPHRALLLSPDHALHVDDALIPVHLLVNGHSIARVAPRGAVTYHHVELDAHAVLLAEGLPAESYLDTGNRALFEGNVRPLHADPAEDLHARAWSERACALLLLGGARVHAVQARLAARAAELGYRTIADAGLVLEVDGVPLTLSRPAPDRVTAMLPPNATHLRLRSRRAIPSEHDAARVDRRMLGVAVAALRLDSQLQPLNGPAFGDGFHALERADHAAWRWTDGDAAVQVAGGRRLELDLLQLGHSYSSGERAGAYHSGDEVRGLTAAAG